MPMKGVNMRAPSRCAARASLTLADATILSSILRTAARGARNRSMIPMIQFGKLEVAERAVSFVVNKSHEDRGVRIGRDDRWQKRCDALSKQNLPIGSRGLLVTVPSFSQLSRPRYCKKQSEWESTQQR